MQQHTRHPALDHLAPLAGHWTTEATHPAFPNTVIPGRATFDWLEGRHFLVWRFTYDHPQFPDGIAILGYAAPAEDGPSSDASGGGAMHYFDERAVSRLYQLSAAANEWRFWRDRPDFSQRYVCRIHPGGATMEAQGELSRDGATWEPDLRVTYRRTT